MVGMNRTEISALEHASRSVMAYVPDERPVQIARVMTAALPALGILAACALVLAVVM
jgi:hypothetical protein